MTGKDWLGRQIDAAVEQMNTLDAWKQSAIRSEFQRTENSTKSEPRDQSAATDEAIREKN